MHSGIGTSKWFKSTLRNETKDIAQKLIAEHPKSKLLPRSNEY